MKRAKRRDVETKEKVKTKESKRKREGREKLAQTRDERVRVGVPHTPSLSLPQSVSIFFQLLLLCLSLTVIGIYLLSHWYKEVEGERVYVSDVYTCHTHTSIV